MAGYFKSFFQKILWLGRLLGNTLLQIASLSLTDLVWIWRLCTFALLYQEKEQDWVWKAAEKLAAFSE